MQENRDLLINTYQAVYGLEFTMVNLGEMAADLSNIAGRTRPWTGKFLHSLIKEYSGFKANDQLLKALTILNSRQHGEDEVKAQAKEATVLSVSDLPAGTMILGEAKRCAALGCPVLFVPTHPRQKYHSKVCAKLGRRTRRSD